MWRGSRRDALIGVASRHRMAVMYGGQNFRRAGWRAKAPSLPSDID